MSTYKVDFPSEERASTDVNIGFVIVIAAFITVCVFGAAYPFKGTFIRDLLMGRNEVAIERVIFQGLTIFMWALSCATVLLKSFVIRGEHRVIASDPVPPDLDLKDLPALVKVYEDIKAHPKLLKRIGLSRVARILAMWVNTEDFERTTQYAKEDNELDAFTSDSSFRANRLFIWAMPLLGFVGTVYGVSYGIGGFAEFLRGQVTAEEIKFQVGLITEGLAVAFYCTLLGLCTAGIAAFPSLFMERKEEEVLEEIDEYVQRRILARMPSVRKTEFPTEHFVAIRKAIENIKVDVRFPGEELTAAIEAGFSRLPDPAAYEKVFRQAVVGASDAVAEKYNEFATGYEHRITELGTGLANTLAGIADRFGGGARDVAAELRAQTGEIIEASKRQVEAIDTAHKRYVSAISDLDVKELARWEGAVADFRELAGQLSTQFREAVAQMQGASADYSRSIDASAKRLDEQLGRVVEIGATIDQLLKVAGATETALSGISASRDFSDTLSSLRNHLEASDKLLKVMSKPRTITLQESISKTSK
jgi:biopolymer transport protein ExbB/TolQ